MVAWLVAVHGSRVHSQWGSAQENSNKGGERGVSTKAQWVLFAVEGAFDGLEDEVGLVYQSVCAAQHRVLFAVLEEALQCLAKAFCLPDELLLVLLQRLGGWDRECVRQKT